ncbi:MAG: rod shape-determining protein MreC [Candidatus Pacebacteria bacterium]|nr:rod shape-determining protein MreC [Candidatus Paceibacterota bacterium]
MALALSFSFGSRVFNYIGKPIWVSKKVAVNELGDLSYLSKSRKSLDLENQSLLEENSRLKILMIDYQILKKENDKLKSLIGRISPNNDFILGSILTKPNYSPYDTLIIDIGENQGLKEGLLVYVNGNIPIGVISQVYTKTSLVELYSNPSRITHGLIEESNITVELIGRGGGNFEMSLPFEITANKGTSVLLPNINSEILAVVEEDISDPTDPIRKIILRSPINIQNEKWVQVKIN